jgi:hypothetical protein
MNISKHIKKLKHIRRKGLSEILFMAFAAVALLITVIIAFK